MSLLEFLKRPFIHTLALVGYLALLATGIPLAVLYRPTAVSAAESIRTITFIAPYGWLLRNLHYWAAMLLLLTAMLHLLRLLFIRHPRLPHRRNWLWGLAVLLLSGLLAFSGFVLRWDVDTVGGLTAVAAITQQIPLVGDGLHHLLVGGAEITDATLGRFYIGHILGLSGPLLLLLGWQAIKRRPPGGQWGSPIPHISPPDGVVVLALLCLLLGLALWVDAPLAPAVNGLNMPGLREWGE